MLVEGAYSVLGNPNITPCLKSHANSLSVLGLVEER